VETHATSSRRISRTRRFAAVSILFVTLLISIALSAVIPPVAAAVVWLSRGQRTEQVADPVRDRLRGVPA
jgi:hypothetical protein